jgi:uncharacterized membrane protein
MIQLIDFKKEILTLLIAASPFLEIRAAIPVAVILWEFSPLKAYFLGVLGNFLPVIPLLLFWKFAAEQLSRRFYLANRFLAWLFERTRRRYSDHFEFWQDIALFIFVAIPLPFTGAWSGSIFAFVFGNSFWRAVAMIGLGIMVAGLAVFLFTMGAAEIYLMF